MTQQCKKVKAIVFDWAGTTVDHGCRAPAIVFQAIFKQRGIEITPDQAREPMGMAKRDHIAAIAAMPEVSAAWQQKYGQACGDAEIDAMYQDFIPLQKETLSQHTDVIAGVPEAVAQCRAMGLKIGSSTGYTRELMDVVEPAAREQGYSADCVLCVEDAPRGRPAPYLLYEASKRLDAYPLWQVIKVDDTPVGIEAGRNAGCWTVGITRTGNCVGLSVEELAALSDDERRDVIAAADRKLHTAGAHETLESVADIVDLVVQIDSRLAAGEMPF